MQNKLWISNRTDNQRLHTKFILGLGLVIYLAGVDLRNADLRGADLSGADLHGATNNPLPRVKRH